MYIHIYTYLYIYIYIYVYIHTNTPTCKSKNTCMYNAAPRILKILEAMCFHSARNVVIFILKQRDR